MVTGEGTEGGIFDELAGSFIYEKISDLVAAYSRRMLQTSTGRLPWLNEAQKIELGRILLELREERGKQRQEFADTCNMDVSQLLRIERGQGEPGLINIFRIATGLGMRPGALVDIIFDRLEEKGLLDGFLF